MPTPSATTIDQPATGIFDEDDDFDCTYASFYFSIPDELKEALSQVDSGSFDPSQRWVDKLEEIKNMNADQLKEKYPSLTKVVERILGVVGK
jgi:hypothetical protein